MFAKKTSENQRKYKTELCGNNKGYKGLIWLCICLFAKRNKGKLKKIQKENWVDLGSGGPLPLFVCWEKRGKLRKYKSELVG